MAKKTKKSSSSKRLKGVDELSIFFDSKIHKELLDATEGLSKESALAIIDALGKFNMDFNELGKEYITYAFEQENRKKADAIVKKIEEREQVLIDEVMAVEGGYEVLALAEKKGAKIDWQKMSPAVITTKDCITFLVGKKYDFNAEHDFGEQKADFTTYHLTATGYWEEQTIKSYDELGKQVEEREKLIKDFQKLRAEYEKKETTDEQKILLEQQAAQLNERYLVLEQQIPETCQQVNEMMHQYFTHASCLKTVMDKKLISDENIQRIMDSNFDESVGNMLERHDKMQRYNEFFNSQTSTVEHGSDEYGLAVASPFYGTGTLGVLAASENKAPALTFGREMMGHNHLGNVISQHAQVGERYNPNDAIIPNPMNQSQTNN